MLIKISFKAKTQQVQIIFLKIRDNESVCRVVPFPWCSRHRYTPSLARNGEKSHVREGCWRLANLAHSAKYSCLSGAASPSIPENLQNDNFKNKCYFYFYDTIQILYSFASAIQLYKSSNKTCIYNPTYES